MVLGVGTPGLAPWGPRQLVGPSTLARTATAAGGGLPHHLLSWARRPGQVLAPSRPLECGPLKRGRPRAAQPSSSEERACAHGPQIVARLGLCGGRPRTTTPTLASASGPPTIGRRTVPAI